MQPRASRELLTRYLSAFEGYLPAAQRADIVAELSDTIQSQMEEREAALGRSLTIAEQAEIIKPYGPPAVAASRYLPRQQLIGPVLLPYYWNTLKIVILFALAIDLIALLTGAITNGDGLTAFMRVWGTASLSFFVIVGVVTTIFLVIDRLAKAGTFVNNWDPRKLPKASREQVPRSTSLVELVLNVTFVFWLLRVPFVRDAFASLLPSLNAASAFTLPFSFSPVWQWGIIALVVVSSAHAIVNAVNLVRPDWVRLRAGTFVLSSGFTVGVVLFMMQTRPLIWLTNPFRNPDYMSIAATFDSVAWWGLASVALVCLVIMFIYARTFVRLSSAPNLGANHVDATAP